MTRDMRPDELEAFEEDIVQGGSSAEPLPTNDDVERQSEIGRETVNDKDEDGLPDDPAKYRVPS